MKQKTSKIVLVLASLFFGVFFFFNTAFAESGDKGIIVDGFYYNENDELTFAWSVDAGYFIYGGHWFSYFYYIKRIG